MTLCRILFVWRSWIYIYIYIYIYICLRLPFLNFCILLLNTFNLVSKYHISASRPNCYGKSPWTSNGQCFHWVSGGETISNYQQTPILCIVCWWLIRCVPLEIWEQMIFSGNQSNASIVFPFLMSLLNALI